MSRRRGAARRSGRGDTDTPRRRPKSSYREYLERCEFAGREPEDFMAYLAHARRWRTEYGPARERGDRRLMSELEELLCV